MQIIFRLLDLQLFAEGDGGTAAEATGAAAEVSVSTSSKCVA